MTDVQPTSKELMLNGLDNRPNTILASIDEGGDLCIELAENGAFFIYVPGSQLKKLHDWLGESVATRTGTDKSRVAPSAEVGADPQPSHEPCPECAENEQEAREANARTDKVAEAIRNSMPQVIRGVVEQFGQYIVHGTPGHYGWLPEDHDLQHNCDAMACGQDHALARFPIERASQPP